MSKELGRADGIKLRAQVSCKDLGKPKDVLELNSEAIPAELEWGEVTLAFVVDDVLVPTLSYPTC